jgi:hypothetical protein
MKRASAAAYAAALSMGLAGHAWANQTPEQLSETQLDAVVAAGYMSKTSSCSSTCSGSLLNLNNIGNISKVANGNKILSGNEVNVLNGNNTAVGVGILGTGAIAFSK